MAADIILRRRMVEAVTTLRRRTAEVALIVMAAVAFTAIPAVAVRTSPRVAVSTVGAEVLTAADTGRSV